MAYTQNLNDIKELLKPGIVIPTIMAFVAGILWIVYLVKLWNYEAIIFGSLFTLIATAGVMSLSFAFNITHEMKGRMHWPQTIGEITVSTCDRSSLTTRTGADNENSGLHTQSVFTPHISYRYFVDSKEYNGTGISGPLTEGCNSEQEAESVLKSYPVGKKVPVYYSRRHPETAVLERNAPPIINLPLLVGLLFVIGSLSFGWVFTVYACYGGKKSVELYQVFDIPPQMRPAIDRCLGKIERTIEAHPKFKSGIIQGITTAQTIAGKVFQERGLSIAKMENKLKEFNSYSEDGNYDNAHRLSTLIWIFFRGHYYHEAVHYSQKLIAITSNDYDENYNAMTTLARILAESGQIEEADKVLHNLGNRWGEEMKKNEVSLDEEYQVIHKWPQYKPAKKPLPDRFWKIVAKTLESSPKVESNSLQGTQILEDTNGKTEIQYCSPKISKSELLNKIALINEKFKNDENVRFEYLMHTYRDAHYYDEAVEYAKKLIVIAADDFYKNWDCTESLAQLLAEANRTDEAQKVLHTFAEKWGDKMKENNISLELAIRTLSSIPRGTPPKE